IETVTGEKISSEELGGAHIHNSKSGNAHIKASTEEEALDAVKKLLSYLPANNNEKPSYKKFESEDNYCNNLTEVVPFDSARPYDVKNVIHIIWTCRIKWYYFRKIITIIIFTFKLFIAKLFIVIKSLKVKI